MTATLDKSNQPNNKGLWLGVGIFTLALAVRLVYFHEISKSLTFLIPISDSGLYDRLAHSLAQGGLMQKDFFLQSFFYPFFLSVVYFFSGSSIIFTKLTQILLGSVVCVLVYQLGQMVFDRRTGILAGVITALYGPLIFFESELVATGWASFWSVALLILLLKAAQKKGPRLYFALGICGGLSVVTRATFLPFCVAACVWLVFALRRASMPEDMIAVRKRHVLAGFFLILVTVSILSLKTTGRISPFPESGPINFYIGNNPDTDRTIKIRPGDDWKNLNLLAKEVEAKDRYEVQQFFRRRFFKYVVTEPVHFVTGLIHKSIQFVSSREIQRIFDVYESRRYSLLLSGLVWKTHGFGFPFGVLLPLVIIGVIHHRRRIPLPIFLFLILYPSAIILVFVTGRYRVPIVPVLAVVASAGLFAIIETIKMGRWRRMATMVGIAAASALLFSIAGPFAAESIDCRARMYGWLASKNLKQGRFEKAAEHLSEALLSNPDDYAAHDMLGTTLNQQGKQKEAIKHFKKAIEINPEYFSAYNNLGSVLAQQGKIEEAVKHFEKALEINPQLDSAHYNLALSFLNLGQADRAVEHLHKALAYAEASGNWTLANKIRRVQLQIRQSDKP